MVSQWILLVAALYCAVVPAVKSQLVYNASTAVDCDGSWSACSTACETASQRVWSETAAPALGDLSTAATNFTFTGADPGEGLDFSGNFLYAIDIRGPGGVTIGDAHFTDDSSVPGVTASATNEILAWDAAPDFGNSAGDDALESLMHSMRWSDHQAPLVVTLDVTPGVEYRLQLMFHEQCCSRGFDVLVDGQRIVDEYSPQRDQGGLSGGGRPGAAIHYDFVAQGGTVTVSLEGTDAAFADTNPILNALTLEIDPGNSRGAACPPATDCQSGEGSCSMPPLELTETMLTVSSESPNIALHRPALQSTLGTGVIDDGSTGWAGRAVDGNTATDWGSGSCTETVVSGSDNPWWRVDLGATYALSSIAILHRSNCCSDRMEGAVIYSSDVDSYDTAILSVPCGTSAHVTGGLETIDCDAGATAGRYVFVVIPYTGRILQMCEFEAFATNQGAASLVDGDTMTMWLNAVPAWIEADLGTAIRVIEYSIQNGASPDYANDSPSSVALRGSDDRSTQIWMDVHAASNLVWSAASQRMLLSVSKITAYRYFRFDFAHSDRFVILSEIAVVGRQLSCADVNADGTTDDHFDCSSNANLIDASPEDSLCAADPCIAAECCTVSCQPTLSIDPPTMSFTTPQPLSMRASLRVTDSRCDEVSESLISFDWTVSATTYEYELHADKMCSGSQQHNNASETFDDAVALCNAAASCGGIADYQCDSSWFTLCDAGSTLEDHSNFCSHMQISSPLSLAGVPLDGPVLALPAFTLPAREAYRVSVTASVDSTDEVFTQHTAVSVQSLSLVASISGPRRRTVHSTSDLVLDASSSFDQDVLPALRPSDRLTFHWTCTAVLTNEECTPDQITILVSDMSELQAQVIAQSGTFDLTVVVGKVGKDSVMAITTIVVIGQTAPTVLVEPLLPTVAKFNADSTLSMIGEVTGEVTSWEWTVIEGADIIKINFQPPDMAVPDGFLKDSGGLYGAHANGYSYGWSCDLEALGDYRDRNSMGTVESSLVVPDRYQNCETENWKIAVPNGQYVVTIGFSDPSYDTDVSGCTIQGGALGASNSEEVQQLATTVAAGTVTEHHAQVDVADGFITFDGEYQSDDGLHCTSISYMVIEPGSGNFVVVPSDKSLTPLEGNSTGIANLVLSPGVFAAGGVYTFRLTARATGESGYGEVVLLANTIPSGGVMQCSPTTGYAIETLFSLRTDGWTDDDEGPLSYRFGHSQPSGVTMLSDFSASYTTSAILPRGETIVDLLEVFVEAQDIYLGVGQAYLGITVHETQIPMSDFASTTESLLALSSGDVHTISQLISTLAATLNANQRGESSSLSVQEAAAARTSMTMALESVFDAANTNPTGDGFGRVAASIAAVVQEPQELTQAATNKALSILQDLCAAGEQIAYPTDEVGRATSFLMDSIDQQQGSVTQDQSRGDSLSSIIESVGNRIGSAAMDGQMPSVMVTSHFSLTVARDMSSSFEGRSLKQGAVIVPNGAFAGVAGRSMLAQIVEYDTGGPLFYTRDEMADGSGVQQASGVTSVSFKSVDVAVSVGRRALQSVGAEVAIANLSEPFLITTALYSSLPTYSINGANMTLEEVELYISRLWNRSVLQAEVLAISSGYVSSCAAYVNETTYVDAVQQELEKLRLRAETEKIICPTKPDSCDAARAQEQAGLKEKAAPGCAGIRGGAHDCAFYPEACACFRGLLRNAYTKESLLCTHWDGTRWNNDGALVRQTQTSATCAFTHLTSFRNFVGPPPSFNRMSVKALIDKEWIANNPVSAITAFVTLGLSLITTTLAIRVYKDLIREVTDAETGRINYEARTSEFVRARQLLERDDVNWFHQLAIKLRIDWPLGALMLGFSGDPFPKTQRLLVVWGSILVGMVLNVFFFTMPDPNCYADCPDETYTEGSTECSETCDKECRGNGLLASLLSAVLSIPVCGTLNLVFAWLRRPFDGDMALKQGVIGQAIRERVAESGSCQDHAAGAQTMVSEKPTRCARCNSKLLEWIASRKRCLGATCPCLRRHQIYPDFKNEMNSGTSKTTSQQHRRVRRTSVAKIGMMNGREAGHRRREHEISLEQLWSEYDPEQTGEIHQDKLRLLMEDLNAPDPVSDDAVAYIIGSADVSGTGTISRGELRMAVPLYLALQQEQLYADDLFDQLKSDRGELPVDQLSWILAEVSGIGPSQSEFIWTVNMATQSKAAGSSYVGSSISKLTTRSSLTRMEVRKAVVVWAPHAHKRQVVPPPPKAFVLDPNSRRYRIRLQMEQIEQQLKPQFDTAILTSKDLLKLMNSLNEGEPVSDAALAFVLHAANITSPDCIHANEVIPALALYVALQDEQELIDSKFGQYDTDQSGTLSKSQLTDLLADLDGGNVPSDGEVDWVMKTSASAKSATKGLRHAELRRAVALWFPRVMTRRAIEEDVKRAVGHNAGARRRAVAAQLAVHQLWVEAALQSRQQHLLASDSDGQVGSGTISRRELQQLMRLLADGDEVSSDEVEFVLLLADHPATESHVIQSDLIRPLAMWRGLQEEMDFIEARFHSYDTNNTGRLDREQLASMIKDVNGGHAASPEEINWMLSLSTDGKSLTHMQSRLAITIWFHHVAPPNIKARVGRPMLVPFIYTLLACTASAVVVAATTVLFSEQKTEEWLAAVGMSLLWRNCLIDPLKAVMYGRSFEFVFALVLGGCALEEAGVGLLQDEIEGQGEAVAEGAQDVVTDLADDGGEELVGAVGGDGAVGGIEGELTAGAGRPDRELSDADDDVFDQ